MMKACCSQEARKSLARPRDVATCDECGRILLAYGNARDFESAIEELARHGVEFEAAPASVLEASARLAGASRRRPDDADFRLSVIAKARKRS
jgi:hypothetical protein